MRVILLLLIATVAFASDPYPKNKNISVDVYSFKLELNDSTDVIAGEATIILTFSSDVGSFDLNLIGKNGGATGMEVESITSSGFPIDWSFKNDLITIKPRRATSGENMILTIVYRGIPADGLIISKNKFGDRTFFGDNWPDRGRHWLPTIDHPSYKAPVTFTVIAPEHYQVVATGILVEESNLDKKRKLTVYSEREPVSVKVMTIGVGRFAVKRYLMDDYYSAPVTAWVYPQNRDDGFNDFTPATDIFKYFYNQIGPYPFGKLAHVQSKTRFGGLENAGNIFYFENVVNGKRERDGLIAHETAHQWFGNSVTERDWYHVWLSEGFATYFAAKYMEDRMGGKSKMAEIMSGTRTAIIEFAKKNKQPIVDTTITDINKVLSTNTYQKAAWVLHMLRHEMGDDPFQRRIQEYYSTFAGTTVLSEDFIKIMQRHAPVDLTTFFERWLYVGNHPHINGTWTYDAKKKAVALDVTLSQNGNFGVPLEIRIDSRVETVFLEPGRHTIRLKADQKPTILALDPGTWLLFEGQIQPK